MWQSKNITKDFSVTRFGFIFFNLGVFEESYEHCPIRWLFSWATFLSLGRVFFATWMTLLIPVSLTDVAERQRSRQNIAVWWNIDYLNPGWPSRPLSHLLKAEETKFVLRKHSRNVQDGVSRAWFELLPVWLQPVGLLACQVRRLREQVLQPALAVPGPLLSQQSCPQRTSSGLPPVWPTCTYSSRGCSGHSRVSSHRPRLQVWPGRQEEDLHEPVLHEVVQAEGTNQDLLRQLRPQLLPQASTSAGWLRLTFFLS